MNIIYNNLNQDAEKEIYSDIKKLLYKIRYCKSKSSFEKLTEEINSLYLLCEEFDLFEAENPENYVSRGITAETNNIKKRFYLNDVNIFEKYLNNNIDHFYLFAEQTNLFDDRVLNLEPLSKNKITDINEIIEYATDFMKYFDKRFIDSFNLLKDNNHLFIAPKNVFDLYEAVFIPTQYCQYPYMGIFTSNNIDDSSSIVHEIAHMVNFNYANNNTKTKHYPYFYQEVYSHFAQFAFYEYMNDKKIYSNDISNFFNSTIDLLGSNLGSIYYTLNKDDNYNYEELYSDIQYGYGIAIALKYLDIYKNDPEKAKYLTNQFIEYSYHYAPIETLNKFGLNEEELTSGELIKKYLK